MSRIPKRERRRLLGKAALEIIEEAVHLLRSATAASFSWYFAGTLPFVLGLLYFWGDMSRSPFAAQHLVGGAITLSALFLWMKTCHSIFSRSMRALLCGQPFNVTGTMLRQTFLAQAAIQPSGLFLIPLSLVPALPFAWVYAFYQNACAIASDDKPGVRHLVSKAFRQAFLWPAQNHCILSILVCFALFVSLNLMAACFVVPTLLKMLFGIETVFTRSGLSMLNTTFFAAVFALTYLCVDPILKTVYALRCFYGEAQRSGADLRAELRLPTAQSSAIAILIVGLALSFQPVPGAAAEATPAPAAAQGADAVFPAAELDRTIQEVVQQPKYAWRQPRIRLVEDKEQKGFLARLLARIKPFVINSLKAVARWLDSLFRRLFARQRAGGSDNIAARWVTFMQLLLYGLILATVAGLIWLFYRIWRNRRKAAATLASEPMIPVPDLSEENLAADQLPEEGWMGLAQKLLSQGELRLALRAFYLASLALLASKNLIQLARFKSNRDYERELGRRAHALPELVSAFGENLFMFDRAWYGLHEIDNDAVQKFANNVSRIRDCAAGPAERASA
ncbi:MAG TPA: hypothetical protein VKY92_16365 [Verrucomicrobiae bacterium]|nr:hypothetical protein [Verrucomicrobiae bacterium]